MEQCYKCGQPMAVIDLTLWWDEDGAMHRICLRCDSYVQNPPSTARVSAWRTAHPERAKAHVAATKYGVTVEEAEDAIRRLGGQCPVCGETMKRHYALARPEHGLGFVCSKCDAGLRWAKQSLPEALYLYVVHNCYNEGGNLEH